MADETTSSPSIERITPEMVEQAAPQDAIHLTMPVEENAHIIVEVAAPLATLVYDQGTIAANEDGETVLDLKFPAPQEQGDVLLRVVSVDEEGTRTLVSSQTL